MASTLTPPRVDEEAAPTFRDWQTKLVEKSQSPPKRDDNAALSKYLKLRSKITPYVGNIEYWGIFFVATVILLASARPGFVQVESKVSALWVLIWSIVFTSAAIGLYAYYLSKAAQQ